MNGDGVWQFVFCHMMITNYCNSKWDSWKGYYVSSKTMGAKDSKPSCISYEDAVKRST